MKFGIFLTFLFALLWLAVSRKAVWRERASRAEKTIKTNRKAHDIKNTIARDADERQRVRDYFDAG